MNHCKLNIVIIQDAHFLGIAELLNALAGSKFF